MNKAFIVISSLFLCSSSQYSFAVDSKLIEEIEYERTEMCVLDAVDGNVLQGEMYEYQSTRGRNPKELWSEDSLKELEKQTGYGQNNSTLGNNHPLNAIASQIKSLNDRKRAIREPFDNRFKSACGDWCLEYKNSEDPTFNAWDKKSTCKRVNPDWVPNKSGGMSSSLSPYVCKHAGKIYGEMNSRSDFKRIESDLKRQEDRIAPEIDKMRSAMNERNRQYAAMKQDELNAMNADFRDWQARCNDVVLLKDIALEACNDAEADNIVCTKISIDAKGVEPMQLPGVVMYVAESSEAAWNYTGEPRWMTRRGGRLENGRYMQPALEVPGRRGNFKFKVGISLYIEKKETINPEWLKEITRIANEAGMQYQFGDYIAWPSIEYISNVEAPLSTENSYYLVGKNEQDGYVVQQAQMTPTRAVGGRALLTKQSFDSMLAGYPLELHALKWEGENYQMIWGLTFTADEQVKTLQQFLDYFKNDFAKIINEFGA